MALHPTYGKAVVALPLYSAEHETVNSFLLTFIFNQNSSPLPSLTSLTSVPTAREVRAVAAAVLQGPGRADVAAPERRGAPAHLQRLLHRRGEPPPPPAHHEHGGVRHAQPEALLLLVLPPDGRQLSAARRTRRQRERES